MSDRKKLSFELKVLLIDEGGRWAAQCLNYDIAAQGKTITQAMESFSKTFAGNVCLDIKSGKEPLEDFTPAPIEYWDMWKQSDRFKEQRPFELPKDCFLEQGCMPTLGFADIGIFDKMAGYGLSSTPTANV